MLWLVAAAYDPIMRRAERASLGPWRRELLAALSGSVLELGAGTGVNVPLYPPDVTRVVLSDPDRRMRARLVRRVGALRDSGRFEVSDAAGEKLPWPDATFDAVVVTLVLCSVRDVERTLAEVRRVLVPGGALVYLEHVADDARPCRLGWQKRLEPVWRRALGNCHLTRRTADAIRAAGFSVEREERASARAMPPVARWVVRGVARRS